MKLFKTLFIILCMFTASYAYSDQEASNTVYVRASQYGRNYAKSIPKGHYGSEGKTSIYKVNKNDDELLYEFDWYSSNIFLLDYGISVVRMGSWARGREPNNDELAIAFYSNGKLLKKYSTKDIANIGHAPSVSVSHYTLFKEIIGYRRIVSNDYVFDILMHNDQTLSFNVSTGKVMDEITDKIMHIIYNTQGLKSIWWHDNKEDLDTPSDYLITEEDLRSISSPYYEIPSIPEGYTLKPGSIFIQMQVERTK